MGVLQDRRESSTSRALTAIEGLLEEPGRKALTRKEVLALGHSAGASDRALRALRDRGRICRFGAGVYGVGRAKVFEAAPQALAALGYEVLPGRPVQGYSERANGTVLRLNKRCRRKIRGHGVCLTWEMPTGEVASVRNDSMTELSKMPSASEIEDHYHRFEYCASLARAEKDLLVNKALDAMERFEDAEASLAIDGGTALTAYHRVLTRFSEDIDLRIVLPSTLVDPDRPPRKEDAERIDFVKSLGERFATYIAQALPWLTRTRKGRIRKDGVLQTFIYNYDGRHRSEAVKHGIKFEVVDMPMRMPSQRQLRKDHWMAVVDIVEIAAGKWSALGARIPGSQGSYPDLVRHLHDIAMVSSFLRGSDAEYLQQIAFAPGGTSPERIASALEEFRTDPGWSDRYMDYMRRMGLKPVDSFTLSHPTWTTVFKRALMSAVSSGMLPPQTAASASALGLETQS